MTEQPDVIRLTGLRAVGYHGVFDHERRDGQEFVVDLEVFGDLTAAGTSDALAETVDYGALATEAITVVTGAPFDLIEAVAEEIARRCLTRCREIAVTVHKPQAPIPHAFDDVSVTVVRRRGAGEHGECDDPDTPHAAVLALGANLGDALATLRGAVTALDRHPHITVTATSRVYRTAPLGGVDQPDFLNAVITVRTALAPAELLGVCQGIEVAGGRTREVRWGPRTLDIDLIRFTAHGGDPHDPAEETRLATDRLTLPHPRSAERGFVLAPWNDVAPTSRVSTASGELSLAEALDRTASAEITMTTAELR